MQYTKEQEDSVKKYEAEIGLAQLKDEQISLYRNTNGKEGKYWMACSPKEIDHASKKRFRTQYDIAYWVNYGDDETYGWFTVEQIKLWLTTPGLLLYTLGGERERIRHDDKNPEP